MSVTTETLVTAPRDDKTTANQDTTTDRRADIDVKQAQVAALLHEVGCEGLLALDPDHFAWLTSGGTLRGILDPREQPAVFLNTEQRWALCSNVDTQRLFDEELDGLGFLLKEWPWHWGRDQLIIDLCQGRKVACDRVVAGTVLVADKLRKLRRKLTPYDQACYRALGQIISHALEATCRTMSPNETEREIAGQLSHRLMHRGVHPTLIAVAADGRSRLYRQHGFTSTPIAKYAVLTVVGRKYGLYASASRAVSFGPPEEMFRREHDAACKVSSTYIASTWPDAVPRQILAAGRRIYQLTGFEHEWLLAPQGHVTGRVPVEQSVTPQTAELFQAAWAVTWHASVGAALSCDTFLITEQGPELLTTPESWPLKRIRVQGADFMRPDVLVK